jgi:peptide deformylase
VWKVEGAISELIQHEYDHLDGVLCTMRAMDEKSYRWKE